MAKFVLSRSTTSPLHQVRTVAMNVDKFPEIEALSDVALKLPIVLMIEVRLLMASCALPVTIELTIFPSPKGMQGANLSVVEVPKTL